MLDVEVNKNGETNHYLAVNDAVIARGQFSKIIDINLYLDDEWIAKYRADGLLLLLRQAQPLIRFRQAAR